MQGVSQAVTANDLKKIRQINEENLQQASPDQQSQDVRDTANLGSSVTPENRDKTSTSTSSQSPAPPREVILPKPQDGTPEEPPTPPQDPPAKKLEYNEGERALLDRLLDLEQQTRGVRDMWRQLYAQWQMYQMQAIEEFENYRQQIGLMWSEVAVSRWVQGTRHAESVRSFL